MEELRDDDPERRAAALKRVSANDLRDPEVYVAFLGCAGDLEWAAEAEQVDQEEGWDIPWPDPPAEAMPYSPTVGTLFNDVLARLELPGDAAALGAFERALASTSSGAELSSVFRRTRWDDEAEAVRRLAPALLKAGGWAFELAAERSEVGLAALLELGVGPPWQGDLVRSVARRPEGALLVLARLEAEPGLVAGDEGVNLVFACGEHAPQLAARLLGQLAEQDPLALGLAAVLEPSHAPAFAQALSAGLECRGDVASTLYRHLRSHPAPDFPLGPFLARLGRGLRLGRERGVFRDPSYQAWLRTLAASDAYWLRRALALCLLIRGGAHAEDPGLVSRVQTLFAEDRGIPGDEEGVGLCDLALADPPVEGLVTWLAQLALSRTVLVGQVASALAEAHTRALPGAEREALLEFTDAYLSACEGRERAVVPAKAGDVKAIPGFHPERLRSLAERLEAPEGLIARIRALEPTPVK